MLGHRKDTAPFCPCLPPKGTHLGNTSGSSGLRLGSGAGGGGSPDLHLAPSPRRGRGLAPPLREMGLMGTHRGLPGVGGRLILVLLWGDGAQVPEVKHQRSEAEAAGGPETLLASRAGVSASPPQALPWLLGNSLGFVFRDPQGPSSPSPSQGPPCSSSAVTSSRKAQVPEWVPRKHS